MPIKYDYDKVKEYIESKGCILLSEEYINNKTKLKIQCKCGSMFERCFQDFKNKNRYYCQICSNNKVGIDRIKNEVEFYGNELISTRYDNAHTPLLIKCGTCGEIYETTWELFTKSKTKTCPSCAEKTRRLRNKKNKNGHYYTLHDLKQICESTGESKLLSKEYNPNIKLKLKCSCGNEYEQGFYHIYNKIKNNQSILCDKCIKIKKDKNMRLSEKEINLKIKNHYGYQKYIIIDYKHYENKNSKVNFMCVNCKEFYFTSLGNLLNGERLCPNCEREYSKGVYKIIDFLEENNIIYKKEKTFKDCKYKKRLPFDFYLPKYNACIEFDGEQHFKPIKYYGGEESFKITQLRDGIKNKYCKNNNIPLLRIKFDEINDIEKILNNFIDKLIPR